MYCWDVLPGSCTIGAQYTFTNRSDPHGAIRVLQGCWRSKVRSKSSCRMICLNGEKRPFGYRSRVVQHLCLVLLWIYLPISLLDLCLDACLCAGFISGPYEHWRGVGKKQLCTSSPSACARAKAVGSKLVSLWSYIQLVSYTLTNTLLSPSNFLRFYNCIKSCEMKNLLQKFSII